MSSAPFKTSLSWRENIIDKLLIRCIINSVNNMLNCQCQKGQRKDKYEVHLHPEISSILFLTAGAVRAASLGLQS